MKKCFLLLFVLLFTACSEKSLLNDPAAKNEVTFLKMPAAGVQLEKKVVFSAFIEGSRGGRIPIFHSYITADSKIVLITGSLEIPANAFTGSKIIRINLDDENAIIDFSPSPCQFNIPLKLNLQYRGLNLNGLDQNKVQFYFISDDMQTLELIKSQSRVFDVPNGIIGVVKAEINHFSRFGWVI
jgi:hypothetical protein